MMDQHFTVTHDDADHGTDARHLTAGPVVSVGEKDFYDPIRLTDAVEYNTVRSYSQR